MRTTTLGTALLLLLGGLSLYATEASAGNDLHAFFEQQAQRAELRGRDHEVRHWNDQLRLLLLERDTLRRAEAAEGDDAATLRVEAAALAAEREAERGMFEVRQRLRDELVQLADRAAALRTEGRFDEAGEVELEIQHRLRANDPDLRRANDLKKRAVLARADGEHEDATLFDAEAERLLMVVKNRYAHLAGYEPPASTTVAKD